MVGSGRGDSVVVIQGGRLVYEKYAPGITADSIEPSFSVSKSFTSTMIGLLVQRGELKLDDRARSRNGRLVRIRVGRSPFETC